MEHTDCRLSIKRYETGKAYVEYVVDSEGFQPVEAPVCADELTTLSVQRLNRWIAFSTKGSQSPQRVLANACERDDIRALGLHLYAILFNGVINNDPAKRLSNIFLKTYTDF